MTQIYWVSYDLGIDGSQLQQNKKRRESTDATITQWFGQRDEDPSEGSIGVCKDCKSFIFVPFLPLGAKVSRGD